MKAYRPKVGHRELEVKLDASEVNVTAFREWCYSRSPCRYLHVVGPDVYYTQGKNVLRHRQNGEGAGELTVKRRTSKTSTKDRLEIDLRFDALTSTDDVTRFLTATGWIPKFTVVKDCHIFWFTDDEPGIEAVLYDVRCILPSGKETKSRRFAEFEIHKEHSWHARSLTTLKDWEKAARSIFPFGETMKDSLYEIYSGRKYQLVKSLR